VSEREGNRAGPYTRHLSWDDIRSTFYRDLAARTPSSLSLEWHIVASHAHNLEKLESPKSSKGYQTPLWEFTRAMKVHPQIDSCSSGNALARVEEVFDGWTKCANGPCALFSSRRGLKSIDDVWLLLFREIHLRRGVPAVPSAEDARVEFMNTLEAARFAAGADPLDCAFNLAQRSPLELPCGSNRGDGYAMFVSLAGWLQNIMGDRPIGLPCDAIGKLLAVTGTSVSRYRKWATESGFIRKVKDHAFGGKPGSGKATMFRFDVTRFPALMKGGSADE